MQVEQMEFYIVFQTAFAVSFFFTIPSINIYIFDFKT